MSEAKDYDEYVKKMDSALRTPQAETVVWEILSYCDIYGSPVNEDNERFLGRREVGLRILALLEQVDPHYYPRLILKMSKELE